MQTFHDLHNKQCNVTADAHKIVEIFIHKTDKLSIYFMPYISYATRNVSIGHGCPHTPLFCQSYVSRSNMFWATCAIS
jgi:hypothetical protein